MRAELMGAQDQIAFKRLLLISSPHCSCSSLAPLLLLSFLYTVSPTHSVSFFSFLSSPQGLDKYSFFPFLVSDEDSLHLSLAPFIFSRFAVFIYHAAHLSRFLPLSLSLSLSLSPSVSCHLFVFPFSFCHRKLPVLSVSPSRAQHSLHSHVSLVGLLPPFVCYSSFLLQPHPSHYTSFASSGASTVLQGVFGVMAKPVLSPRAGFQTPPSTHRALPVTCGHTNSKILTRSSRGLMF